MRQVIFIQYSFPSDPREFSDLIGRWKKYALKLSKIDSTHNIRIIHFKNFTPVQNSQIRDGLQDFYTVNNPLKAIRLIKTLKSIIEVDNSGSTLVCGDTHISYLMARILRLCIPNQIRIQTQFHGDIYSIAGKFSISRFLRVAIARNAIKFSDSIRIVSNFQRDEIVKFSPEVSKKFVVAPIALDTLKISTEKSSKDIDVLFVGRLHKERGISELISLIKVIIATEPTIRTLIVGEGPQRDFLSRSLKMLPQNGGAQLVGYLENSALLKTYSRSKVLVSTAPSEGYGLALREAAINGLLVVARYSRGAKETQELFPSQIFLYENLDEASELVLRLYKSNPVINQPELLAGQKERDLQAIKRLIKSWI